jgi:hypothetical protein
LQIDLQLLCVQDDVPQHNFVDLISKREIAQSRSRHRQHPYTSLSHEIIQRPQDCESEVDQMMPTRHCKDEFTSIHIHRWTPSSLNQMISTVPDADFDAVIEIHIGKRDRNLSIPDGADKSDHSASSPIIALLERTRPKRLAFRDCNFSVSDLFCIMEVVKRKHVNTLECLDLRHNGISVRALQWIISIYLGSFHKLKELYLRQDIRCMVHQNVRNAILEGLLNDKNQVLETIDLFHWDRKVEHVLDLNRAGRRTFQIENFPISLWPKLLERATTKETLSKKCFGKPPKRRLVARQASVLYHLLRHGPILFHSAGCLDDENADVTAVAQAKQTVLK